MERRAWGRAWGEVAFAGIPLRKGTSRCRNMFAEAVTPCMRAAEIADVGMRNMRRKRLMASSKHAPIWDLRRGRVGGWEVTVLSRGSANDFLGAFKLSLLGAAILPRGQHCASENNNGNPDSTCWFQHQPGICRMRVQSSLYLSRGERSGRHLGCCQPLFDKVGAQPLRRS